eukprot:6220660-Heterocapsa_arctica.AAC.1
MVFLCLSAGGLTGSSDVLTTVGQKNWNNDGAGHQWKQGSLTEFWLHQGPPPAGSGPEWRSTQPQWECNHDQKKG